MIAARAYAQEHGFSFTEVDFSDYKQALAALDEGRIDAVALSSLYKIQGYRCVATTAYAPYYVVAQNNSDGTLLQELDEAVDKIMYDHPEFMGRIFDTYYGRYSSTFLPSLTRSELAYIQEQHIIRVGCFTDWYPLVYADSKTGEAAGVLVELFRLIGNQSGLQFQFVPIEGDSSIEALKNKDKDIDLFIAVLGTKKRFRDNNIVLSHGYVTNNRAFAGLRYRNFDMHEAYTVAIPQSIRGSAEFLKENYPQFTIVYYPDLETCFRAVRDKKADAVFHNSYIISAMLQHTEFEGMTIWDVSNRMGGLYYAAARGDVEPRLMSVLNKYIDALSFDDVQAIIFRNTSSPQVKLSWRDFLYKYSVTLAIAALLIGLIAISVIRGIVANGAI